MNVLLKSALLYENKGFSVIPIGNNKKPLIKWIKYQNERASREQITSWWKKHPTANIGIVTGAISNLLVVDIDSPEALEEIEKHTPEQAIYPIATTPRGGQHRYFLYKKGIRNATGIIKNVDIRAEGGYIIAPPSQNHNGSYVWVEGLSIQEVALTALPDSYYRVLYNCKNNAKENNGLSTHCLQVSTTVVKFTKGYRDNALFHLANYLVKGGMPVANIPIYLKFIAEHCNPPFSKKEVDEKIISALNRAEKKEINLAEEVWEFVLSTTGNFLSTEIHSCLQLSTRAERKNVSMILSRLRDEGIIEKHGSKNGCFRMVENECIDIDWQNVEQKELDIKYPLVIDRYFCTMPKNIICIAGSPDAGKTAFLLNFIKLNMHNHKIHYFSSEMGAMELKSRLSNFDIPLNQWKFNAKERAGNFADVIRPNDINIIDFLEISDSFYKIGEMITAIFNKLDQGIVLIALQKNKGAEVGRGGGFGLEKPRLYITVDPEYPGAVAKIIKCKNWRNSQINPNGMQCKFKLVGGAKIIMDEDWMRGM